MRYDPAAHTLRFSSAEEAERFHGELTELVRRAVIAESAAGSDQAGAAAGRAVMKQFVASLRALNAFRGHLSAEGEPV